MILYDISKNVFSEKVFPGDPVPRYEQLKSMQKGDQYNLSSISMCVHTSTHIDAPLHFCEEGASVDEIKLSVLYGTCTVITVTGILTGADMEQIIGKSQKRLLLHGDGQASLSVSAAQVLAGSHIILIGTDAISIAADFDTVKTHYELARADIVVLEGLDLSFVEDGKYTLSAFPVKLEGLEASPCRAVLFSQEKGY